MGAQEWEERGFSAFAKARAPQRPQGCSGLAGNYQRKEMQEEGMQEGSVGRRESERAQSCSRVGSSTQAPLSALTFLVGHTLGHWDTEGTRVQRRRYLTPAPGLKRHCREAPSQTQCCPHRGPVTYPCPRGRTCCATPQLLWDRGVPLLWGASRASHTTQAR